MKGTFFIAIITIISMLVIPLSALSNTQTNALPTYAVQNDVAVINTYDNAQLETIKVLKDGNVTEVAINDYIFGVVAAEMPALYHEEALKAQAVAAYTFALYQKTTSTNTEYDISADADTAQCYITRQEAYTRWSDKAQEYETKIDNCIVQVKGQWLSYNSTPIFAAYHAISSGTTNSCADVWGKDLQYLKSVDSVGDKLANGYLSEAIFTTEQITEKLKTIATPSGEPQNYFSDIQTTNNGYVLQLNYCSKQITGADVCQALNLRSSNFKISFADGNFTFVVKGYGHGVGMSQTGADYMANQGSSYDEILLHYYGGATLEKN